MEAREMYYKSDILIRFASLSQPFQLRFYATKGNNIYEASCIDGECKNCKISDDGGVIVVLRNHALGCGALMCEVYTKMSEDNDEWEKVRVVNCGVLLVASNKHIGDNIGVDEDSHSCDCPTYEAGENVTITEQDGKYYINAEGGGCDCESIDLYDIENLH